MELFRRIKLLTLLLALALFVVGCPDTDDDDDDGAAVNPISGAITSDLNDATYTLVGDANVPEGVTVSIAPGTQILVDGNYKITVKGRLLAQGAEENFIHFTSGRAAPDRGDWKGIVFDNAEDGSIMEYVRVSFAAKYNLIEDTTRTYEENDDGDLVAIIDTVLHRGAITMVNCSPEIRRSIIEYSGYDGIHVVGESEPVIQHNTIVQNAFNGIRVEPDWVAWDASGHSEGVGHARIADNIISDNDDAGIRLPESQRLYRAGMIPRIEYNNVYNNAAQSYVPPGWVAFDDSNRVALDTELNPQFVDMEAGDYRLHPCSGLIDAATPEMPADPDGTRRDMGALWTYQGPNDLSKTLNAGEGEFEPYDQLTLNSGETYHVTCDVFVDDASELTIEPGAVILFDGRYSFTVAGKLTAQGAAGNEIIFSSNQAEPGRADWKQLVLDRSDDSSVLEHVVLEYGSAESLSKPEPDTLGVLSVIGCSPQLSNIFISESYYGGLYCYDGAAPTVTDLTVDGVGLSGLICELNSGPVVQSTAMRNVLGYGLYCASNSSPRITNLLIYNVGVAGVKLVDLSNPTIEYMTLYGKTPDPSGQDGLSSYVYDGVIVDRSRPVILNSIIHEFSRSSVISQISALPRLGYTLLYSSLEDVSPTPEGNVDLINEPIYQDPLFTDPASGNFTLRAGSPGLTAGEDGGEIGAYGGPHPL